MKNGHEIRLEWARSTNKRLIIYKIKQHLSFEEGKYPSSSLLKITISPNSKGTEIKTISIFCNMSLEWNAYWSKELKQIDNDSLTYLRRNELRKSFSPLCEDLYLMSRNYGKIGTRLYYSPENAIKVLQFLIQNGDIRQVKDQLLTDLKISEDDAYQAYVSIPKKTNGYLRAQLYAFESTLRIHNDLNRDNKTNSMHEKMITHTKNIATYLLSSKRFIYTLDIIDILKKSIEEPKFAESLEKSLSRKIQLTRLLNISIPYGIFILARSLSDAANKLKEMGALEAASKIINYSENAYNEAYKAFAATSIARAEYPIAQLWARKLIQQTLDNPSLSGDERSTLTNKLFEHVYNLYEYYNNPQNTNHKTDEDFQMLVNRLYQNIIKLPEYAVFFKGEDPDTVLQNIINEITSDDRIEEENFKVEKYNELLGGSNPVEAFIQIAEDYRKVKATNDEKFQQNNQTNKKFKNGKRSNKFSPTIFNGGAKNQNHTEEPGTSMSWSCRSTSKF